MERARKEKRPRKESSMEDDDYEDNSSDCEVMVQIVRLSKEKSCVKKGPQPKKVKKTTKKRHTAYRHSNGECWTTDY